jgi:hypothetical protein
MRTHKRVKDELVREAPVEIHGEYVLPFGYDQLLSVEDEVGYTVIEKISLDKSRTIFYSCEKSDNDDFVSVYFLGYGNQKNIYLEKLYVNEDGSKEVGILRISPRRKLLKEKGFSVNNFEFNNFDKVFLVVPNSQMFQLTYSSKTIDVSLSKIKF